MNSGAYNCWRIILTPVAVSISATNGISYLFAIDTATPLRPARPVRPIRWMYVSVLGGKSKLMTNCSRAISRPLAATSVATRIYSFPSRNIVVAWSRSTCCKSACKIRLLIFTSFSIFPISITAIFVRQKTRVQFDRCFFKILKRVADFSGFRIHKRTVGSSV